MKQRYQHRPYDDDSDFPAQLPARPRAPKRPPISPTQQRREKLQQLEDREVVDRVWAASRKREEELGGRGSLRYHTAETARLLKLAESAAEPVRSMLEASANDHMNVVRELRGKPTVATKRRMEYGDRFRR